MSNLDKIVIIARLSKLSEAAKYLKDLQKLNQKSFLNDYHNFLSAERGLQLCIEAILDVGRILISKLDFRRPYENQDIITTLAENKVITGELHDKLIGMARFRNILVHEYAEIDRKVIYQNLQTRLQDFEEFKKQITKYLRCL